MKGVVIVYNTLGDLVKRIEQQHESLVVSMPVTRAGLDRFTQLSFSTSQQKVPKSLTLRFSLKFEHIVASHNFPNPGAETAS